MCAPQCKYLLSNSWIICKKIWNFFIELIHFWKICSDGFCKASFRNIDNPRLFLGCTLASLCVSFLFILYVSSTRFFSQSDNLWTSFFAYLLFIWTNATLLGCGLWQIKIIAHAANLLPVRIATSVLLFVTVLFSHICAAQYIAEVFPVDPNQLGFGLAFGTALITLGMTSFAFALAMAACSIAFIVLMLRSGKAYSRAQDGLKTSMVLCAILFLCLQLLLTAITIIGLSDKTKILISRFVAEVDFSDVFLCVGVHSGDRVVRLGSQGDRGIAASFGQFSNSAIRRLTESDAKDSLPSASKFYSVDCNMTHK